jgi:ketosteroid isomerase-like protein
MDAGTVITRYLELVGAHDLAPLEDLFADDLVATTSGASFGKAEWIAALRRLLPVLVRNDIRHVFVDGDDACAVYDFVTDTEAGAVPCVEWITVTGDRISRVELIFEKANWAHVAAALQERAAVG